ncbi:uncharacterized protein LY79DRAFT_578216 [Colletotrichum navitas]|uniref:Uncharacterized protein n=1 Tax=Colletotrichum navitas TaxID=681940 RepID=A0AAD8Q308_9PEZI|nr:uncharacterized protein LY79DRAFT_578216 [Colletotrichum navitas]KAK1595005.1 hypothetical protein LY79DRAFT_578216 [Colletotrichum navitas]
MKLKKAENLHGPALSSNFGPNAIFDMAHGLNLDSLVTETFHAEAIICTRTLVNDKDMNPHYWTFRGPPRKVQDNADPTDPNRSNITLVTRPMPVCMNSADRTPSFNIP